MGGMAAQIPIKDKAKNEEVFAKVRADKLREVKNGHDGTWVAHPGLVPVAMAVFDEHMPEPNQLLRRWPFPGGCQAVQGHVAGRRLRRLPDPAGLPDDQGLRPALPFTHTVIPALSRDRNGSRPAFLQQARGGA
jgi:hypothetical protein